jgi:two-component system response regulator NreC
MSKKTKILLCDDHTLFREGLKAILSQETSFEVIGEARDGRQAVDLALKLEPDVVVMDIAMPELSGFEATRRIKRARRRLKVLILTMYEDEELVTRCLDAGASGYVLKDAPPAQLLYAIDVVSKGGEYLSPGPLKKVMSDFVRQSRESRQRTDSPYETLTERERDVLVLLAQGLTVKEVAARLNLSAKTIDAHKYAMMRKLDIHDRAGLVKYAIRQKLITLNS